VPHVQAQDNPLKRSLRFLRARYEHGTTGAANHLRRHRVFHEPAPPRGLVGTDHHDVTIARLLPQDPARVSLDHHHLAAPRFVHVLAQTFEGLPARHLLGVRFLARHVQEVHPAVDAPREVRSPRDQPHVFRPQIDPDQNLLQPGDALFLLVARRTPNLRASMPGTAR
jgi:hypothetical protein